MAETIVEPLRPHEQAIAYDHPFDAGIWFIGHIRTPWPDRSGCPKGGDPDAGPDCRIELAEPWAGALAGIEARERLQILYWMHLARRDAVLQNPGFSDSATGTFNIRSPLRPNPVASSIVRLLRVEGSSLTVRGLDCVDGTPLIDIKPEFGGLP